VVEAWVLEGRVAAADSPRLRVVGAVDQAGDAGRKERPGAHEAGLQGADQGTALEAPGAQAAGGVAEGQELRVGRGVKVELAAVEGRGEEGAVRGEEQGTDRDVTGRRREGGDGEGLAHPGGPGGHCGAAGAGSHGM